MKAEGDRKGLQHQASQISQQQSNHQDEQGNDWRFRRGTTLICNYVGILIFLKYFHFQNRIPYVVLLSSYLFLDLPQGFPTS